MRRSPVRGAKEAVPRRAVPGRRRRMRRPRPATPISTANTAPPAGACPAPAFPHWPARPYWVLAAVGAAPVLRPRMRSGQALSGASMRGQGAPAVRGGSCGGLTSGRLRSSALACPPGAASPCTPCQRPPHRGQEDSHSPLRSPWRRRRRPRVPNGKGWRALLHAARRGALCPARHLYGRAGPDHPRRLVGHMRDRHLALAAVRLHGCS